MYNKRADDFMSNCGLDDDAEISGYLALQQITVIIKENINVRIAEWRDRPSSAGSGMWVFLCFSLC